MKFSLIILNIKKLIKEQRVFLFILIISQIAACLAIFLAIATIANTRNEQKEIDIRTMHKVNVIKLRKRKKVTGTVKVSVTFIMSNFMNRM